MLRAPTGGRTRGAWAVLTVCVALALASCSTISPERPQPAELSSLRVAATTNLDAVPLRMALQRGVFERAGLNVEVIEREDQAGALAALTAGDADVAVAGNLELLQAAAEGTELEFQGEAYIAGPNTMVLVSIPGSDYEEPTDNPSPVIAIEPGRPLGRLATRSRLATEGIAPEQVQFKTLEFDEMGPALRSGEVDAAWLCEPRVSKAQREYGAQIIADTSRGAMLEFPISSYAAMRKRVRENPRTFEILRRALSQTQQLANDPVSVREYLMSLHKLDKSTVAMVSIGSYPTSLNGVRLQRVADLMHRNGIVGERIDVAAMLPPSPDA
jgi:NitT/TauT family transport system substrate-binding protein